MRPSTRMSLAPVAVAFLLLIDPDVDDPSVAFLVGVPDDRVNAKGRHCMRPGEESVLEHWARHTDDQGLRVVSADTPQKSTIRVFIRNPGIAAGEVIRAQADNDDVRRIRKSPLAARIIGKRPFKKLRHLLRGSIRVVAQHAFAGRGNRGVSGPELLREKAAKGETFVLRVGPKAAGSIGAEH